MDRGTLWLLGFLAFCMLAGYGGAWLARFGAGLICGGAP